MQGGELGSDRPACGLETGVGLALFVLLSLRNILEFESSLAFLSLQGSHLFLKFLKIVTYFLKILFIFVLFFGLPASGIPSSLIRDQT